MTTLLPFFLVLATTLFGMNDRAWFQETRVGQTQQTGDVCPDEACFEEHFRACVSDTTFTTPEFMGASARYEILWARDEGCRVSLTYPSNPNPAWVDKALLFTLDPDEPFTEQVQLGLMSCMNEEESRFDCAGPLLEIIAAYATGASGYETEEPSTGPPEPPQPRVAKQGSLALIAFHEATNGENWSWRWHMDSPVYTWRGVHLDSIPGEGWRVVRIDLNSNRLQGELPDAIGDLTYLRSVDFIGNELTGVIPESITKLKHLEDLSLTINQLSGPLPSYLSRIASLEILGLGRNQFSGEIPLEWTAMPNLRELYLQENQLTGRLLPALAGLENLETLMLSNNGFTGELPPEWSTMRRLKRLYLWKNQLAGDIPSAWAALDQLEEMDLSENRLSGPFPAWLTTFEHLRLLFLDENELSGALPSYWGGMKRLEELRLNTNRFSGRIPPSLGELANLRSLVLNENDLTGSIPVELANLERLEQMYIRHNRLEGEIPPELFEMPRLSSISFRHNKLVGAIPGSLARLSSLQEIYLDSNYVDGFPDLSENDFVHAPQFSLQQNYFHFDVLENITENGFTLLTAEQRPLPAPEAVQLIPGQPLEIPMEIHGRHNTYQWFRNGEPVEGATTASLLIESPTDADAGSYHLEIGNTLVQDLTLRTQEISVGE